MSNFQSNLTVLNAYALKELMKKKREKTFNIKTWKPRINIISRDLNQLINKNKKITNLSNSNLNKKLPESAKRDFIKIAKFILKKFDPRKYEGRFTYGWFKSPEHVNRQLKIIKKTRNILRRIKTNKYNNRKKHIIKHLKELENNYVKPSTTKISQVAPSSTIHKNKKNNKNNKNNNSSSIDIFHTFVLNNNKTIDILINKGLTNVRNTCWLNSGIHFLRRISYLYDLIDTNFFTGQIKLSNPENYLELDKLQDIFKYFIKDTSFFKNIEKNRENLTNLFTTRSPNQYDPINRLITNFFTHIIKKKNNNNNNINNFINNVFITEKVKNDNNIQSDIIVKEEDTTVSDIFNNIKSFILNVELNKNQSSAFTIDLIENLLNIKTLIIYILDNKIYRENNITNANITSIINKCNINTQDCINLIFTNNKYNIIGNLTHIFTLNHKSSLNTEINKFKDILFKWINIFKKSNIKYKLLYYDYNYTSYINFKNNKYLIFQKNTNNCETVNKLQIQVNDKIYNLVSFITYSGYLSGSSSGGHYINHTCFKNSKTNKNEWYEFNDSKNTPKTESDIDQLLSNDLNITNKIYKTIIRYFLFELDEST